MMPAWHASTVLLASLAGTPPVQQPGAVTALTGVTVIDVEHGSALPDRDVVFRGERIVEVRSAGAAKLPAGTRVISGRGKFVIPGLWDMHTHLADPLPVKPGIPAESIEELRRRYMSALLTVAGITGVRDVAGDLAQLRRWQESASRDTAGPPMPRLSATGWKLRKQPVLPGAPFPIRNREDVLTSARMLREQGATQLKLYEDPPAWMLRAAGEACRREGLACVTHIPQGIDLVDGSPHLKSVEHLFALAENTSSLSRARVELIRREVRRPTVWQRVAYKLRLRKRPAASALDTANVIHSPRRAARVYAALREAGTWVTPTLTLHDMMQHMEPRHITGRDPALLEVPLQPYAQRSPEAAARAAARMAMYQQLVRELDAAGVRLLAGTDMPLYAVPGFSIHLELELLQRAGLSPLQALRTATLNPAQYFAATDTMGTVAPGRVADLVVLRENPLLDVRAVASTELVIARGRVLTRERLDLFMAQARAAVPILRQALVAR